MHAEYMCSGHGHKLPHFLNAAVLWETTARHARWSERTGARSTPILRRVGGIGCCSTGKEAFLPAEEHS
jgi:hypothetical protein